MQKSEPGELIYKTTDNRQPAATPTADRDDPWVGWNDWCDQRIAAALDGVVDAVGEALARSDNELRNEIVAAIAKRDKEISELRGQLSAVMTLLQTRAADVVQLPRKHG